MSAENWTAVKAKQTQLMASFLHQLPSFPATPFPSWMAPALLPELRLNCTVGKAQQQKSSAVLNWQITNADSSCYADLIFPMW